MRIDIHNHTTRCNHAEGTVDEYIQKAIELGIDIYGFSEHAPMDFDPHYRLAFEEMQAYTDDILNAKERYKNDINILFGYEVDYLPGHMDDRVLDAKVDYLIGSVHFIDKWSFDNPEFIAGWKNKDIDEIWQAYFEATDSLQAIKKSNMVLEVNTAGLRKPIGELYPSRALLEEAYALDIPITFSSDAHSVEQIGFGYDVAIAQTKEIGYTKVATFEGRDRQLITF
jgi:histidinol-phosphatase (PHP family)